MMELLPNLIRCASGVRIPVDVHDSGGAVRDGTNRRDATGQHDARAVVKIILVRGGGKSRSLRVDWRTLLAGVCLVFGTAVAISAFLYPLITSEFVIPGMIEQWRDRLADQDARVQNLERQAVAESGAVGRQLGQMQARLWRMEALGVQVADVAEIPLDEFGFDLPAPQGGPVASCENVLEWPDLRAGLDALAIDIRDREDELQVLESVLGNQEYRAAAALSGWPVTRGWISSPYGRRVDPISGKMAWHTGIDFAGRKGSDVTAIASGVVVHAGSRHGYGKLVEIDHGDGFVTRYAHHDELLVRSGDIVRRGDAVGSMGVTGRTTGPHVHIEVLKNGRHVNPARYVSKRTS